MVKRRKNSCQGHFFVLVPPLFKGDGTEKNEIWKLCPCICCTVLFKNYFLPVHSPEPSRASLCFFILTNSECISVGKYTSLAQALLQLACC